VLELQVKDTLSGGIFQTEREFGVPVTFVRTLRAGIFYFVKPCTGKVNFPIG
jgi:hypothetical protein